MSLKFLLSAIFKAMSQSTKVMVALMFAFVIYTTMRGHLRNYLQVMGLA